MRNLFALSIIALLASCSSETPALPGDAYGDLDAARDEVTWDFASEDVDPDVLGGITGTVFSPAISIQYRFPIPEALVFLDRMEPGMIPEKNYCDKCIDLAPATPYAMTDSYGVFRIEHVPAGDWILVVQKGQFRRVRRVTVYAGETLEIPVDMTTLPNIHDPGNGDNIPRIAVASGSYDWFEDLLAKFGLADLGADYHYVRGTEEFTLFSNGGRAFGIGIEDFKDLVRRPLDTADQDDLMDFNILFIPCTDGRFADEVLAEEEVKNNLRSFVAGGGKLYVSDWSYDFIEQVFPEFVDYLGDDAVIGSAEDAVAEFWNTTGSIRDADLSSWLTAMGIVPNEIEYLMSWVAVEGTSVVPGEDDEGNPVDIASMEVIMGDVPGHGSKPLNVTFNYGCGKVLFTTYHTIGALVGSPRPEMITQEKILLYLLLDIAVCSDSVVIPI
jgi:hypothetical protein